MKRAQNRTANRLIHETSPYLLQHAYNPVDWYPWGKEAFEKARREEKPVFLSVGYSACHWCHVMERESFEDPEVAEALNRDYVCVKADREERPDVDAAYMRFCQATTGQGGWPLTVLMTPEQKPFFAGTYFPKHTRYGSPGLLELLEAVSREWKGAGREALLSAGEEILAELRERKGPAGKEMSREMLSQAAEALWRRYDRKYGGFGGSPKFPMPHQILFLLRYFSLTGDPRALTMAEGTLTGIFRGGIFDHIGSGFSRYSTDERWLVPHFEKMLYDNALLTLAYLEGFQLTGKELYRRVAEKTLGYVLREMTGTEGGFYSSQDADSSGEEGSYYLFSPEEAMEVLGKEDGEYFCEYYGITPGGNFEGKSIPNLLGNPRFEEPDVRAEELAVRMLRVRKERTAPDKDDKVLSGWNGLMIAAFARAHRVLGGEEYLFAARRAVRFLEENLLKDGFLQTAWRGGRSSGGGFLEDYAFAAWGFLELYEAAFDPEDLEKALRLARKMTELFGDDAAGGFYLSGKHGEKLVLSTKEAYDGALPSGNSAAAFVLGRLARMTGDPVLEEIYRRQLGFLAGEAAGSPAAIAFGLIAAFPALYPFREIVCAAEGETEKKHAETLLRKNPLYDNAVLLAVPETRGKLEALAEFTAACTRKNEGTTLYVCRNNACSLPVTDPAKIEKILSGKDA